jgi:hypothetical protein
MSIKHFLFLILFFELNIQSFICADNNTNNSIVINNTTIATTRLIINSTTEYVELTEADDYYANVDPRLTYILNTFYPDLTNEQVAHYSGDIHVIL